MTRSRNSTTPPRVQPMSRAVRPRSTPRCAPTSTTHPEAADRPLVRDGPGRLGEGEGRLDRPRFGPGRRGRGAAQHSRKARTQLAAGAETAPCGCAAPRGRPRFSRRRCAWPRGWDRRPRQRVRPASRQASATRRRARADSLPALRLWQAAPTACRRARASSARLGRASGRRASGVLGRERAGNRSCEARVGHARPSLGRVRRRRRRGHARRRARPARLRSDGACERSDPCGLGLDQTGRRARRG